MYKKRTGAVLLFAILLAVARTIVVILNMEKNNYENDTYYLLDNLQSSIFTAIVVICLAFFIILAIKLGKGKRAVLEQKNDTVSAASCMLAFILLGTVVIFVITYLGGEKFSAIAFTIAVLSVFSAIAFLLTAFRVCGEKMLAIFALFPLFLTVFRVLNDFINTNSAPFASSGAYHIMSLTVVLLYFLCEGKSFLSRGSAVFYYMFGYGAVVLLMIYSLPNLMLHCFGVFSFDYNASLSVVDLVMSVYICVRMSTARLVPLDEQIQPEEEKADI